MPLERAVSAMSNSTERDAPIIAETSAWIDRVVIGLGLCPFAKPVQVKQLIRYRVTHAENENELLAALEEELTALTSADPELIDTTLLIHPPLWVTSSTTTTF